MATLESAREAQREEVQEGTKPSMMGRRVVRGAPDLNNPPTPAEGRRIAQSASRPGEGNLMGPDIEATPEEQAEYERAVSGLGKVLYENDQTAQGIAQMLTPQEKVGSVAKAAMLVVTQLDQSLDLDETVIPQITMDAVDRVIDLYENMHGDEFTEPETQAATGATWEGVMETFGVDEDSYAELTAGMSDEDFAGYEQQYAQLLSGAAPGDLSKGEPV